MNSRLNSRTADLTCLIFLLAAGIRWSLHLPLYNDLMFGDEAEYLRNGVDLFRIVRSDWGPAYNLWYKGLSLFTSDSIKLYYLNYATGAILAAVLLYVAFRRYHTHPLIAVYLAYCFLISDLNINTWPRVSHFIVIVILLALITGSAVSSAARRSLIYCTAVFITAYARPDLMFAFFIMLPVALFLVYREREQWRELLPFMLALLLAIGFFQGVFGLPASDYRGEVDRLYIAFGQHFTINYKARTGAEMDAVTDWLVFCRQHFPGCETLGDILKQHPGEVMQNALFNLKHYLLALLGTILSFIFPEKLVPYKKLAWLFLPLLAVAIGYLLYHKDRRRAWLHALRRNGLTLGFLFIFGLTSMGMCIVIFPRNHYIILHSLLLLFLLAGIFQAIAGHLPLRWYFAAPLFLLLFITPTAKKYKYMQINADTRNGCSQKMIRFLNQQTDRPYVIFSSILNISYPLPENFSEFNTEYELKTGMRFSDVLREKRINMILVTENLHSNPVLRSDSTWTQFIADPGQYGFRKTKYHDLCESYFLVKDKQP